MRRKTITIASALLTALVLASALVLTGCINKSTQTDTAFLMDTVIKLTLYGADEEALSGALDTLSSCEELLVTEVPPDAQETLDRLINDTGGVFDHRIGKLTKLWGIGTEAARVPAQSEIDAVINDRTVFDPGAYGKGYACDALKKYFDEKGIEGACIAVGGSVLCYGKHEGKDYYTVAVRDPAGSASEYIGVLKVKDAVVSTSGDYEHVYEQDGKKYHHILDPHTGYPADSGLTSVTVVSRSGILSDALSTAAFALGLEEGRKLLLKYGAEGIFIDKAQNIYITDGIRESFEKR